MTTPADTLARIGGPLREELFHFLRIPSVSARSEHRSDVRRAAAWVSDHLRNTGFSTQMVETPGHPIVLGEWREAGPEAPTLLIYGHYDVQPAEPLELWTSPPFEPEIRDGRLYARGATDDKGQLYLHLKALEILMGSRGGLPVNVVVVAEGEEEVGSPNLLPFLRDHQDRLACDAVIISDSQMFAPGVPSLLSSLRGLAYVEIHVQGARSDLHSGAYGGAVPNAATVLARLLASLHDADGRVAIPGFYDRVVEWDSEARAAIDGLPFDEEGFRHETGAPGLQGEAGYRTLERLWIRPTCEVNGLLSGYTGEGAKTVLPARAMAKVSFRLVPDQDPDRISALLRSHLQAVAPPEVKVEVRELHHGRPWRGSPQGPFFEAARRALARSFGQEPVLTGEGGSIPIVSDFEEVLGAPVLLLGFGLPGSNLHAPDEWFPDAHLEKGIETLLHLYGELDG
ncbi:MAG: dipeptidase [Gemmatimonadales bacterium]|nr:MAG: dipeptidase [Gemmatimonadales bacterium]